MNGRIDLGVGAYAHALLTKPIGKGDKGRRQVEGFALVRVLENHVDGRYDVFEIQVVRSTPAYYVGRKTEIKRCDLFASSEPAEMAAYRDLVNLCTWAA